MVKIVRTERRVRSGWGVLWRTLLVLVVSLGAYDLWSISTRVEQVRRGQSALGQVIIANVGQSKMIDAAIVYGAIAVVLGLFCLMTRGRLEVTERRIDTPPSFLPIRRR